MLTNIYEIAFNHYNNVFLFDVTSLSMALFAGQKGRYIFYNGILLCNTQHFL